MKLTKKLKECDELWENLGDVPVNESEEIEEDFLHFEKGTDVYEIWHWFEETYNISVGRRYFDFIRDEEENITQ
jgi:hypothetical protein